MKNEKINKNIIIYKPKKGRIDFRVQIENETVWLTQKDLSGLFGKNIRTINEHIKNIFKEGELEEKRVIRKFRITAADGKKYEAKMYNLDVIISVGYRVKSREGVHFRIWATSVLRKYLVAGYAINENRIKQALNNFEELQNTISFLGSKIASENLKGREQDIFNLLSDYSKTLSVLEEFDKNNIGDVAGTDSSFILDYESAIGVLKSVKQDLILRKQASDLFATERGKDFQSIIGSLYQTFDGRELYSSIEKKAAHLLYFTIKDHPFSDGNKRSGAFLFVYFLKKNNYLYKKSGEKKINDNALAALALLVAESNPKEKDLMIKLIMNLISEKK